MIGGREVLLTLAAVAGVAAWCGPRGPVSHALAVLCAGSVVGWLVLHVRTARRRAR